MIVYHGTWLPAAESICENGILLEKCKERTDFGRGFYTSEHFEFAADTALNKMRKSAKYGIRLIPAVVELEYNENCTKLKKLEFSGETMEWLRFIINNRSGKGNMAAGYDIISGRIADGEISRLVRMIQKNPYEISEKDIKKVQYHCNPHATQISFHTEDALRTIKPVNIILCKE